ncbi:hypothetical protein MNV_740003 [Candidatus Methanoperedens nitroreducens]|uniref:Transposase n=1 Tax=Candidatus Methanoperedens nitratireducens TaxID=1392998 RepID=A0A284VT57_9EURY|nr:hypothetical protein MNV_740003 [Candidatus Methanoperedens nitroreducens]
MNKNNKAHLRYGICWSQSRHGITLSKKAKIYISKALILFWSRDNYYGISQSSKR